MNKEELLQNVEEILNEIRPYLVQDGGNCELIDITDDNIVHLKLVGACGNCPSSTMTLKAGIESYLKEKIPTIQSVERVY